ncbi:YggS family pyridoxal phosphate-dependent enzyme [Cellulomonas sp. H30R-01]|uniref:YggS family pyridoxal phosphate-dependent enzyme n=1 Tax=Cellulomonas sp. H30R-01 TaxID=2704467 RepID=UPI00138C402C|nr:YggS family pyridoxal phosphate-dependent enzyme [Cellulomonas sp. H30R-01]QHT55065.1 YggS family pyridoxal phosphate-dependent enzyme [Cellulomonas sp. H30R-01]
MTETASDDERTVLADRLAAVRARVATASAAARRDPRSVRVLLATKTVDAARVRAALAADAAAVAADPALAPVLIGENRVQELVAKGPSLADLAPVTHLIGPLQSNKVNAALRWVSCVESVESLALARRLSERCADRPAPLDVLVQVNVSGEPTKHGIALEEAADLAVAVAALPALRLAGFMTVGLRSPDPAAVGAGYAALAALRDAVVGSGEPGTSGARTLSMGMSGDLEVAVRHGATLVRVGSAVFGARPPL